MVEDISNKTIVVLVILTVIISLLGTVVVLNEISNVEIQAPKAAEKGSSAQGQVTLGVTERIEPDLSTGFVTLGINEKK